MKWKKQLLDLTPYQPGKSIEDVKKQYGLEKIVKLASNENPFGCSEEAAKALQKSSGIFAKYPDGYAGELRSILASHLGTEPGQLIFGNGSDEVIQIISRALLGPGRNTIMAAPTFPQYKHNAVIEGAEVKEIPLLDGAHDLEGMLEAIDENTSVVWLCSPNNPTGIYINESKLVSFLEKVPEDILVVLDEAYCEYAVADDYYHAVSLLEKFSNLIVLRTFSKIYGLASLRIGYGIAGEDVVRALEPAREPFNVNTFAQMAAAEAVKDQQYVEECRNRNREGLEQFYSFCDQAGLSYYPSQGNFILIDFKRDANEVFQYLLEKGYIVRSGAGLGCPQSIRVTIGSKEQNEEIMELIGQFLEETAAAL
ncbi:MAG: histidinol-phosphate transaminase [Bacillota bacterium]